MRAKRKRIKRGFSSDVRGRRMLEVLEFGTPGPLKVERHSSIQAVFLF